MNFLAHIFLSGDNNDLKIGNFIADHVKGNAVNNLPKSIREGVLLHRKIDYFTDHHPVVLISKERLRPEFRKYSPVVVDIFYDHCLAVNWKKFSDKPLDVYAQEFYQLTSGYSSILPARTIHMLKYMIADNWLLSYASIEGIQKALTGMSKRTAFNSGMENAAVALKKNYADYEEEFLIFFKDVQQFVKIESEIIPN